MAKTFQDYLSFKESATGSGTRTEIKLGKDNEYKPFSVDKSHYPNLRILVQAFVNSAEIPIDNEIDSKEGGVKDINMKKKTIYLVGGAVRDHLAGKTPKDFDLVTDATPPQIRRILKHAGFVELKNQTGKRHPKGKDRELPDASVIGKQNKCFWSGSWDSNGTDANFYVKINGEEFELATSRMNHKGENGEPHDKIAFSGIEDDADGRDFTMNAMYIPLDTADGANAKMYDMHGGVHDIKSGNVRPIGKFRERLDEDPLRALRYIRLLARFSKDGKIPDEHREAIEEIKDLTHVPPERIKAEFVHGLEHPDCDPRKYIKLYKDLGVLGKIFPNMNFELNVPDDFTDKKDRILAVAWILRKNDSTKVANMLYNAKWENREVNDIAYLISLYNWGVNDKFNSVFFADLKSKLIKTSLVPSKIRTWGQMAGLNMDQINRFINEQMPIQGSTVKPGLAKRAGQSSAMNDDEDVTSFRGLAKKVAGERKESTALAPMPAATDDGKSDDMTSGTKTEVFKAIWHEILGKKRLQEADVPHDEYRHVRHYDNGYEHGFKGNMHPDDWHLEGDELHHYARGHRDGLQDFNNGDEKYTSHVSGGPLPV